MIEVPHLTLGANKCEVEPHRRGGCQVLGSEPNIADVRLAGDLQSQDIGHTHLVEEMRVGWLVIDFNHPAIFITANPEYSIARHLPTSNKYISLYSPDDERLLQINAGSLSLSSEYLPGDVVQD